MKAILAAMAADILPVILQLVGVALAALLARAASVAQSRWGIEIEARHREALHSALMSGISAALARGLRGMAAVDEALVYTSRSVPDALAALDPSADVLKQLAVAKMREAVPLMAISAESPPPLSLNGADALRAGL